MTLVAPSRSAQAQAEIDHLLRLPELFCPPDVDDAHARWGATCAPAAVAAALGLPLAGVRHAFPWFPSDTWTNIPRLEQALRALPATWCRRQRLPEHGVAIVQFEGPWTAPGADPRRACKYTHWIGVAFRPIVDPAGNAISEPMRFVYDATPNAWFPVDIWESSVLPVLLKGRRRVTGKWHIKAQWSVLPRDMELR